MKATLRDDPVPRDKVKKASKTFKPARATARLKTRNPNRGKRP